MKTKSLALVFVCFAVFFAHQLLAQDLGKTNKKTNFFSRQAEGWFWYQDPELEPEEEELEQIKRFPDAFGFSSGQSDPLKRLEELQEQVKWAQANALMNPTDINAVADYMRVQKGVTDRADAFSNTWQRALLYNPELDATLDNPVALHARKTWQDENMQQQASFLREAAQEWGIWFFYRSDCPYCQRYAPVLKAFSNTYGFEVLAISQDGGPLSQFPDYELDAGHSQMLGISVVPATFLINPATNEIHPVAHGYVAGQDLADRVYFALDGQKVKAVNSLAQNN